MTDQGDGKFTAEIFAIGSELCFGRIYDTNSFWIADQLTRSGVHPQRITCLPDDLCEIVRTLKDSLSRKPTFIFISGGLGPTDDDLTIEALSNLTGIPIRLDRSSLSWMAEKENLTPEKLDKRLHKMAKTLVGAVCIRNPLGWAPASYFRLNETEIFALPGPPAEVRAFFEHDISKRVSEMTKRKSCSKRFVADMYEEELATLTRQIAGTESGVYIKPLVSGYRAGLGLPVDVVVFARSEDECHKKIEKTFEQLSALLSSKGRSLRMI